MTDQHEKNMNRPPHMRNPKADMAMRISCGLLSSLVAGAEDQEARKHFAVGDDGEETERGERSSEAGESEEGTRCIFLRRCGITVPAMVGVPARVSWNVKYEVFSAKFCNVLSPPPPLASLASDRRQRTQYV